MTTTSGVNWCPAVSPGSATRSWPTSGRISSPASPGSWTAELALDLRALKSASSHRVRYLPGAEEFLRTLQATGKTVALVTNAHFHTLEIKKGVAGLSRWIDTFVSSHEFGAPKESPEFWQGARARLGFDPATTLFIDDSLPGLDAARDHGIGGILAVSRPDTGQPARVIERHASVFALGDLR
jgi:5'-nucleotidase